MPPRVRTITIPPLGSPAPSAPRTVPSLAPPPPAIPGPQQAGTDLPALAAPQATPSGSTPRGGGSLSLSQGSAPVNTLPLGARSMFTPQRDASAALPARRPEAATPPRVIPSGSTPPLARNARLPSAGADSDVMPSDPDTLPTVPPRASTASDGVPRAEPMVTEPTPAFSVDELDLGSDTILQLPTMHASDSFDSMMQFRAHAPLPSPLEDLPEPPPELLAPPEPLAPLASTVPLASTAPTAPSARLAPPAPISPPIRRPTPRPPLITPATALFAEPEPDADSSQSRTIAISTPSVEIVEPPDRATRFEAAGSRRRAILHALVMLAAVLVVGTLLAAAALYLTRDRGRPAEVQAPAPPAPSITIGTVKFIVTPTDSAISIDEGKQVHRGSPWTVDLAPGAHQIEIQRDGYKAWLTSTDVVAGQPQTISVPLEPLEAAVLSDATLIVGSTPPGLEAVLDGTAAGKTPLKLSIKVGAHTVVLRKDGADIWKTELDARTSAVYEFSPTLANLAPRAARPTDREPTPGSAAPRQPAAETPGKAADAPPSGSQVPAPPGHGTPPPAPAPPDTAPGAPTPPTVSSTAVARIAGVPPSISRLGPSELPPEISAKLCIDDAGHVTTAGTVTQLPADVGAEIVGALRTWQYAPYRVDGIARAACFVVSFRVK